MHSNCFVSYLSIICLYLNRILIILCFLFILLLLIMIINTHFFKKNYPLFLNYPLYFPLQYYHS